MKWIHHLAAALGMVLFGATLTGAQNTQQSTQWQATQTFLQNMQNQINALKGQNGPGVLPGAAGQFAGYATTGTVISPMNSPVTPGATGQYAGYASGNTIGPLPNPVSSYAGPVAITGNQTNGADQINNVNVNGVINPLTFAGADVGAQVNAAIAALPNGGKIVIPAGTYSFATTIQCPINTPNQPIIIEGAGRTGAGALSNGTTLLYTGSGDAVNQVITNVPYQNGVGCQLRDMGLVSQTAGTTSIGFHVGGTIYSTTRNVSFQRFKTAAIEVENPASMWTERYNFQGDLWLNAIGIYFHCDASCNQSFEHGEINELVNTNTGQTTLEVDGGGALWESDIRINGNNTNGTEISIVGSSAYNDTWNLGAECQVTAGTCTRFNIDSGSQIVGGMVLRDAQSMGPWIDSGTGLNALQGFYNAANENYRFGATLGSTVNANYFGAAAFLGSGAPSIASGSAAFVSGTNPTSTTGQILVSAASNIILTPGFNCNVLGPNATVRGVIINSSTSQPAQIISHSQNQIGFAGVAGDYYDYSGLSCG